MHNGSPSEAHEPLIARESSERIATEDRTIAGDDQDRQSLHEHGEAKSTNTGTLWRITLSAGISGLLFGYDTGVISSTLISMGTSLSRPTTTLDKSLIASSTSLLALLISPVSGYLADLLGRCSVIAIASVFFTIGALVQAGATHVWVMVLGRSIIGAAIGAASGVVPMYIGEIAPAERRGRLVTIHSLLITGGQVVAYLVGWAVQGRWRIAVGLAALPSLVQAYLLLSMPESPRWLMKQGREDEARQVLEDLGQSDGVADMLASIREEIASEGLLKHQGWRSSARSLLAVPGQRRALTIACMLQALQQLCGFNSLMYFSATIFTLVGFTSPITTSLSIALTNFVFTLCAFVLIDRLGRRRILLLSVPFMVVGLLCCSVSFLYITPSHDNAPSAASSAPPAHVLTPGTIAKAAPYALLVSLILYVSAYAIGLGVVPWQQGELFPLRVRSLGSGLATATNWSSNFVVGITFLPALEALGPSVTFAVYAGVCVLGWVAVWCIYPETSGLRLEEVGALLDGGWGVRASSRKRDGEDRGG